MAGKNDIQFLIASHSPILLAYPGAQIFSLTREKSTRSDIRSRARTRCVTAMTMEMPRFGSVNSGLRPCWLEGDRLGRSPMRHEYVSNRPVCHPVLVLFWRTSSKASAGYKTGGPSLRPMMAFSNLAVCHRRSVK